METKNYNNTILYHGSEFIIAQPVYGKGAATNDYGRGFYCTADAELAKEWACVENRDGYANKYDFDLTGLNILHLTDGKYNILNWLALLARYRTYWQKNSIAEEAKEYIRQEFLPDISPYDVIIGYRADDSYFSFAQDFVNNAISLQQLAKAMRLGKLGEQIVLKSERAFGQINFIEAIVAPAEIYFAKRRSRDNAARREYRSYTKNADLAEEIYMVDIMRERMKNDDPRLYV